MLQTHAFIHIPKTGGTSIEKITNEKLSVYAQAKDCCRYEVGSQVQQCCRPASPWHLAPDVLSTIHQERISPHWHVASVFANDRPRWCIVRNPAERFASCNAWSHSKHPDHANLTGDWWGQPPVPTARLVQIFSQSRFGILWTEELAHKQPQSWFVWDEDGRVACNCVVAFEKLGAVTQKRAMNTTRVEAPRNPREADPLPQPLRLLYALDQYLWRLAVQSEQFCHTPTPLSLPPETDQLHALFVGNPGEPLR